MSADSRPKPPNRSAVRQPLGAYRPFARRRRGTSRADRARNVGASSTTGIDYTHPDLAANVWKAATAFTVTIGGAAITCAAGSHGFNAIARTCDPRDDRDHGTHVAGTIAAVGNNGAGVAGENWTASVMGRKFFDATGSGSISDAINAIEFAVSREAGICADGRRERARAVEQLAGGGCSQALLDEINPRTGSVQTNGRLNADAAVRSCHVVPASPASLKAATLWPARRATK